MEHTYAVIMAGGVGSRFWPTSTSQQPKQFLDILGTGESLLQQTFRRMARVVPADHIYIVTHADYADQCLAQIPSMDRAQIIAEPSRRNTAPCVAYAAFKLKKRDPLANFVITPADHLVTHEAEFERILNVGLQATQEHNILLTLGMNPHRPRPDMDTFSSRMKRPPWALKSNLSKRLPKNPTANWLSPSWPPGSFFGMRGSSSGMLMPSSAPLSDICRKSMLRLMPAGMP